MNRTVVVLVLVMLIVQVQVATAKGPTSEVRHALVVTPGKLTDADLRAMLLNLVPDQGLPFIVARGDMKSSTAGVSSSPILGTLSLPPSILSGRPQQYTVGQRWFDLGLSCLSCRYCPECPGGCQDITYHPAEVDVALSSYSGFGGHEANPHAAKPIGRLAWGSQVDGDYTPPAAPATTDSDPALSFVATPGEQAAGQALRVTLPEAAQEILFDISLKCPHADLEQAFGVVIRVEMDVPLQRVETIDSANGKGRLAIERTTNSHGDDAGYASAATAVALQTLIDEYGACPVNARLPSGRRSELTVTGLSLPNGGHYDIARDWTGSHRNHRAGEDTDIALPPPIRSNQARLRCLYEATVDAAELQMPVSSEALVVVNPRTGRVRATADHVHLWSGEQEMYDQDLTTQVFCLLYGLCP